MPRPTTTPSATVGSELPGEEQLAQEAARIDSARATQERSNPVDQVIDGTAPVPPIEEKPTADPMMVVALTMLVSSGVKLLHTRYDWTEPDDDWKKNVATLSALIIDRYIPILMQGQGDVIALLLLVGPYVIENVIRAAGRSDSDPGDQGERKDNFVEPLAEDTVTRFPHPA